MINDFPYLSDNLFLYQLDLEKIKTKIVKIVVLTKEERAIAEVTGRVTSGSINVAGDSSVRRTASLDFVADNQDIDDIDLKSLFVINRKVSLQIGIKNTLKRDFPQYSNYDIIWFPQGIYVMSSPSFTNSEEGLVISMYLQDKMCLLNGDCGGTFPATVSLDTYDTLDPETGAIVTEKVTIYQLITELVNHWGGEQLSKIIIDGVPKTATMGMVWNGENNKIVTEIASASNSQSKELIEQEIEKEKETLEKEYEVEEIKEKMQSIINKYDLSNLSSGTVTISNEDNENYVIYSNQLKAYEEEIEKIDKEKQEKIAEIEKDNEKKVNSITEGIYFATSLDNTHGIYYLGKQVDDINDVPSPPITGYNFEKNNLNKLYFSKNDFIGGINEDLVYPTDSADGLVANAGDSITSILDILKDTLGNFEYFYDIDGNFVFREMQNYLNTSKATSDLDRLLNLDNEAYLMEIGKGNASYIFDNPDLFISYANSPKWEMIKNDFMVWGEKKDSDGNSIPIRYHLAIDTIPQDWENHIYDNMVYNEKNHLMLVSIDYSDYDNFPKPGEEELIYRDLQTNKFYQWNTKNKNYDDVTEYIIKVNSIKLNSDSFTWRDDLYLSGVEGTKHGADTNYYYMELEQAWPDFYTVENQEYKEKTDIDIYNINYYLDIIDSNAEISKYSVSNIGRRTKTYTDSNINCIFEPDIPDYLLVKCDENYQVTEEQKKEIEEYLLEGQKYILVPESIYKNISKSSAIWNSAFYAVRDLLYQYTSLNESITLDCIPIYYLEPNIRISVLDKKSDINGDYIIESYSLPLDVDGAMSISCSRALDKI